MPSCGCRARAWRSSGSKSPRGPQPTNAPPATNQVVEVSARSYDLHTNLAEFAGPVQVTERAGNEVKGTMTCGRLTVWLGPTNELDRMVAQDVVVIQQVDRRFFADKAVYEGAQGVMELTGAPRWEAGERRGQGRVIEVYSKPESMLVRGDASMLLPATELASADIASHATPGGAAPVARPSPARPAATPAGTNGPMAEITAEEYTVTPEVGVFRRHAHLLHPQMDWTSDTIAVEWPAEAATHHIHAEGTVWFQMLSQNDRMLEGQGDQADYTCTITNGLTNEFMVLTGPPALLVLSHKPPDWAPSDNPAQFLPTADPTQSEADKNTVTDSLITMDLVRQHITRPPGARSGRSAFQLHRGRPTPPRSLSSRNPEKSTSAADAAAMNATSEQPARKKIPPGAPTAVGVLQPLLTTDRLVQGVRHQRVVNGVSIAVAAGEIVGLLGPNGAGKTTTFNMVVGVIRPDAGTVRFLHHDITRLPMHPARGWASATSPRSPPSSAS